MTVRSSQISSFIAAGTLGTILFSVLAYFWPFTFESEQQQLRVLFYAFSGGIVLFATVVYQWLTFQGSARVLAEAMTDEILSSSHELFFELYRSSPVPYVLIDMNGIIESTNLAAVRLFNVEAGALDALSIFDFLVESSDHNMGLIPEYIKQGKALQGNTISLQRQDGIICWVSLSFFSYKDPHGNQKGLMTLVDITKEKMIDQAKTEFVSLASHQLRTPISSMKWNLELLETAGKETFNELQTSYLEKIGHGLERMDTLVSDFLSASKIELGTLIPQRTQLDFIPFLQSIYEEHQATIEKKQLRIETVWDAAEGTIVSDSHLLHMIVSNIFSNAVKYTGDGGAVQMYADIVGDKVTVRITDTGMGIPEDDQKFIFTKLFRAGNARAQVAGGTGLGLYIVKEAVRILGGTISFESKQGVGTTFIVVLPKG